MQIAPLHGYTYRPACIAFGIGAVQVDIDIRININTTHYQYKLEMAHRISVTVAYKSKFTSI